MERTKTVQQIQAQMWRIYGDNPESQRANKARVIGYNYVNGIIGYLIRVCGVKRGTSELLNTPVPASIYAKQPEV